MQCKSSVFMLSCITFNYVFFFLFLCMCVAQTGDRSGELTARMNVSDLQLVLGLKQNSSPNSSFIETLPSDGSPPGNTHTEIL